MALRAFYSIAVLLLLTFANIKADTDFKQKFGNEFITDIKHYHAEFLKQNMDLLINAYETMLRDLEPTPEEEQEIKQRLQTIKDFKTEIGDTVSIQITEKELELRVVTIKSDLQKFRSGSTERIKNLRQRFADKTLNDIRTKAQRNFESFVQRTYKRYHEMYDTIPSEELTAHPEFKGLDETMQHLANISERERGSLRHILDLFSLFYKFADFFDAPEYNRMFNG